MSEKKKEKEKVIRNKMEEVTDIKEITLPLIHEYITRQSAEDEDWLIDMLEGKIEVEKKDNEGKTIKQTRTRTFIEIRNDFTKKYFPALAPKNTTKKSPVTKDILADLKERKQKRQ